ncbi:putative siderophore non-ribosomal peptide synthase [Trichinella spiralis]|uniref:putative siderophore non-ribosomal peptide synthase n=1 Tax=Trichinella spiralis TaxID=6334 RepID=UPI0001EFDE8D|nr:putative siderophore non-ribosomal peptide synthase [Trichinella spiralis]
MPRETQVSRKTTALGFNNKETLVPFSLPFTHGVLPACSPAMTKTLRFSSPPLCVPIGFQWFWRLLLGQSRQRWLKPPRLFFRRVVQPPAPAFPASGKACSPRTSHAHASIDWDASVSSGFGLPVLIAIYASFEVILWQNAPQGRVLTSRLCVQPLLPLGRIAR